jgi:hypothetical protein
MAGKKRKQPERAVLASERSAKTARSADESPTWQDFVASLDGPGRIALLAIVLKRAQGARDPSLVHLMLAKLKQLSGPLVCIQWHQAAVVHCIKHAPCELTELARVAPADFFGWPKLPALLRAREKGSPKWSLGVLVDELAKTWTESEDLDLLLAEPWVALTQTVATEILENVAPKISVMRWFLQRGIPLSGSQDPSFAPRLEHKGLLLHYKDRNLSETQLRFGCAGTLAFLEFAKLEKVRFVERLTWWLVGIEVKTNVDRYGEPKRSKLARNSCGKLSLLDCEWRDYSASRMTFGHQWDISWDMLVAVSDVVALVFAHADSVLDEFVSRDVRDVIMGYVVRDSQMRYDDWPVPQTGEHDSWTPAHKAWVAKHVRQVLLDEDEIRQVLGRMLSARGLLKQCEVLKSLDPAQPKINAKQDANKQDAKPPDSKPQE